MGDSSYLIVRDQRHYVTDNDYDGGGQISDIKRRPAFWRLCSALHSNGTDST